MTPLRHRMLADLPRRGLSERTQALYVRAVRPLAAPDHTSPALLTAAARRPYVLSLKHVTHDSRRASPIARCGLTFVYEPTVRRGPRGATPGRPSGLPRVCTAAAARRRGDTPRPPPR